MTIEEKKNYALTLLDFAAANTDERMMQNLLIEVNSVIEDLWREILQLEG